MNEQFNTLDLMRYGVFCAVFVDDAEMLKHFLPSCRGYDDMLEIFRVKYKALNQLDQSMLNPLFSDTGPHILTHVEMGLYSFIDTQSCPALYLCCLKNLATITKVLLSFMMQTNQESEALLLLQNMLHLTCTLGNVRCARVLLEGGVPADENILLATVASYDPMSETKDPNAYLHTAELILCSKTFSNAQLWSTFRNNPLCMSSCKSDAKMTDLLITYGAYIDNPSACDSYKTPLIAAVESSSEVNVKALISAGCDVNLCSPVSSPLGTAVETCNLSIFILLLKAAARPNIKTAPDNPVQLVIDPMTLAASKEYLVFLWLLLCYSGDVNTINHFDNGSLLLTMTRRQNLTGIKLLLRYDANINLENTLGTTPLWAAVNQNNKTLVNFFIHLNCDLEVSSLEYNIYCPFTPVALALQRGFWEVLHSLLQAGGKLAARKIYNPDRAVLSLFRAHPDMKQNLLNWVESVKTLKFLCRCVIRDSFKARIDKKIDKLQDFPQLLKHYILLK